VRRASPPASRQFHTAPASTGTVRPSRRTHTRANSHAQKDVAINERGDDCTSSPRWVRATTISRLSWGLVPFDAYRSEQRPTPGFHTRLCCAFRFSQPLDALFRSQPLRPCFIPVAPLGFRFRRFPLPSSRAHFSVSPVLHVVSETTRNGRPGRITRRTTSRM